MAEDLNLVDIDHTEEVYRKDSNRRYVSTTFPYSCQIGQTNKSASTSSLPNIDMESNICVNASEIDLSIHFDKMHCSKIATLESEKETRSNEAVNKNLCTGRQLNSPVALPTTKTLNCDFPILYVVTTPKTLSKPEKRKRDSPQTRNVREKLAQYAYKDRSTKNVTFALQAMDDATNQVEMDDGASTSASITSMGQETIRERSYTTLNTALPQREGRTVHKLAQHTEEVQTLPTEDQMRQYVVPEAKAPIWKLYEQKLRTVGRAQARVKQLTKDIEDGNPPSWCFGGTQAPQYMRPFHPELVAATLEYAMKMAIIARNILIREADQDAGQARHLQETLMRMYKQDRDPNF